MRFRNWWRSKNGQSKTITVLATLMILQIGLCFSTPTGVSWFQALFHLKPSDDPYQVLGFMFVEAVLCLITCLVLISIAIFWHPELKSPQRKKEHNDR